MTKMEYAVQMFQKLGYTMMEDVRNDDGSRRIWFADDDRSIIDFVMLKDGTLTFCPYYVNLDWYDEGMADEPLHINMNELEASRKVMLAMMEERHGQTT